ncbi:MAG TPA: VapA/VapB family virulence-associated protein [Blastocatellia bacterium]|nr:VapA/VapB family virulence-associated protein [Blastocatellia bacterium]
MNPQLQISRENLARDLTELLKGKLEQDKLDAAVASLSTAATAFPATGSIASLVFYLKFQVQVTSTPRPDVFNGRGFGASSPGAGFLVGHIYTDNLARLVEQTDAFTFLGTPVYLTMFFFNGQGALLGHGQFGAVSTVLGSGGGSGSWNG